MLVVFDNVYLFICVCCSGTWVLFVTIDPRVFKEELCHGSKRFFPLTGVREAQRGDNCCAGQQSRLRSHTHTHLHKSQ